MKKKKDWVHVGNEICYILQIFSPSTCHKAKLSFHLMNVMQSKVQLVLLLTS